jgi:hypothetical protein
MSLMSRRNALGLGAAAFAWPALAQAETDKPVLVELFTSQGCSSCPAADRLAKSLAQNKSIIVVSLNVDYWDYLGWRDTLAKPQYSQRQYDYAKTRGDGAVYTPQMVVNGRTHVVGSNKGEVENHLKLARATPLPAVIGLELSKADISVEIAASSAVQGATLWLMAISPSVEQKIERGENAGDKIEYTNVVRNLANAATMNGQMYKKTWKRDVVMMNGSTQLVAILQNGIGGEIMALSRV